MGKRNIKSNSLNYFDNLLNEVKKEDIEKIETQIVEVEPIIEKKQKYEIELSEDVLLDKSGLVYINNLDIDEETKDFLNTEYKKYFQFSANSSLWLGAYYQNLFDGLGQRDKGANQYTSTYTNYIENVLKVSVRTAKRYRDKYELFTLAKDIKVKTMISLLSHADVKLLYDNKEKILPYLEKTLTPEEMENLIKSSAMDNARQEQLLEMPQKDIKIDISSFQDKILTIGERAANIFSKTTLTTEEKEKAVKISKYIEEIEKLLS